jgi:hypothetical protein
MEKKEEDKDRATYNKKFTTIQRKSRRRDQAIADRDTNYKPPTSSSVHQSNLKETPQGLEAGDFLANCRDAMMAQASGKKEGGKNGKVGKQDGRKGEGGKAVCVRVCVCVRVYCAYLHMRVCVCMFTVRIYICV